MFLSVFDIFKIGLGPSSSHTMGPMVAANRFLAELAGGDRPRPRNARAAALKVSLHGSLAFTGIGHGTDRAIILGLSGIAPDSADPDGLTAIVDAVRKSGEVAPPGHPAYRFQPARDLVFDREERLPGHTNGMRFSAFDSDGALREIQRRPTEGREPREFAIAPDGRFLLIANQLSDDVVVIGRDPDSGTLGETLQTLPVERPSDIKFFAKP